MTELLAVIRDKERRKARRALLIGGAAILAVVGVGIYLSQGPPDVWEQYRQPAEQVSSTSGLPVEQFGEVAERLREEGLSEIVWMGMDATSIEGDAASPDDHSQMVSFFRGVDGEVRVAEPRSAAVDRPIALDDVLAMVGATLEHGISEVAGDPVTLNLMWTPEAVPMIEIGYVDGDVARVAQFDAQGGLVKEYEG